MGIRTIDKIMLHIKNLKLKAALYAFIGLVTIPLILSVLWAILEFIGIWAFITVILGPFLYLLYRVIYESLKTGEWMSPQ